jgi:hypothetical protein
LEHDRTVHRDPIEPIERNVVQILSPHAM